MYIFSDFIWWNGLQIAIIMVFLNALFHDILAKIRKDNLRKAVIRNEGSLHYFIWSWAISIILIEIIISSDLIINHKIVIGLMNFGIFVYLNLKSAYFQNKIIGLFVKIAKQKQLM